MVVLQNKYLPKWLANYFFKDLKIIFFKVKTVHILYWSETVALSLLLSIACVGKGRCSEKHFFRLLNFLNYIMFFLDFEKGGKNLNIQNCIPHTHTQKVKSKRILPFTFYVLRILRLPVLFGITHCIVLFFRVKENVHKLNSSPYPYLFLFYMHSHLQCIKMYRLIRSEQNSLVFSCKFPDEDITSIEAEHRLL